MNANECQSKLECGGDNMSGISLAVFASLLALVACQRRPEGGKCIQFGFGIDVQLIDFHKNLPTLSSRTFPSFGKNAASKFSAISSRSKRTDALQRI